MASVLEHPVIGKIQGKPGDGVVQYLGIKYGHLKDRFAMATLPEYKPGTITDGTKHGPMVLSPPNAIEIEEGLIQLPDPLPFTDRRVSDTDGLSLNITVPSGATSASKFPIFAFIHGGGFGIGSANWPISDLSKLVKRSVDLRTPVIGVGINYRLGVPGFLDSADLRAAGYQANRGLRDQKLALQWIKKHIGGFGGDASAVTVAGQSAGAASISFLLRQDEALAKRVILMSGSDILTAPMPPSEASYDTVCKLLGLEGDSSAKVKALVEYPGLEMLGKLGHSFNATVIVDGDFVKAPNTLERLLDGNSELRAAQWLDSLLIGETSFDGSISTIFLPPGKPSSAHRLLSAAKEMLPDTAGKRLAEMYGVEEQSPEDKAYLATQRFINDLIFTGAVHAYATCFTKHGKNVYTYHFGALNPFPGRWQGESSHILDATFLFQNYNDSLSSSDRKIAEAMADKWIAFTAGKQPFKPWRNQKEGPRMMFGPEKVELVHGELPLADKDRRAKFEQLASEVGYEKLSMVFRAMMASPH